MAIHAQPDNAYFTMVDLAFCASRYSMSPRFPANYTSDYCSIGEVASMRNTSIAAWPWEDTGKLSAIEPANETTTYKSLLHQPFWAFLVDAAATHNI